MNNSKPLGVPVRHVNLTKEWEKSSGAGGDLAHDRGILCTNHKHTNCTTVGSRRTPFIVLNLCVCSEARACVFATTTVSAQVRGVKRQWRGGSIYALTIGICRFILKKWLEHLVVSPSNVEFGRERFNLNHQGCTKGVRDAAPNSSTRVVLVASQWSHCGM